MLQPDSRAANKAVPPVAGDLPNAPALNSPDRRADHTPTATLVFERDRLDSLGLVGKACAKLDYLVAVRWSGEILLADKCACDDRAEARAHLFAHLGPDLCSVQLAE